MDAGRFHGPVGMPDVRVGKRPTGAFTTDLNTRHVTAHD
ncbi:hypothetical protein SNL152K_4229 [Streptomyces sp. NL15-2K]|nr:hypothetical protein SNL152K_4229 [Streptomyces sp. NL15-2K]